MGNVSCPHLPDVRTSSNVGSRVAMPLKASDTAPCKLSFCLCQQGAAFILPRGGSQGVMVAGHHNDVHLMLRKSRSHFNSLIFLNEWVDENII